MTAILDLRTPILVIVGHWNAAILNEPGWIARFILGLPEGQQLEVQTIVVNDHVSGQIASQKQIWLFEQFGISCSNQRLEIFTRDIARPQQVYEALAAISLNLPHTPISGVGTNFKFQVSDDITAITQALATNEGFDEFGTTASSTRTDTLEVAGTDLFTVDGLDTRTKLNLARSTDFQIAEINFNYHLDMGKVDLLPRWAQADPLGHWHQHAVRMLTAIYGIERADAAYF